MSFQSSSLQRFGFAAILAAFVFVSFSAPIRAQNTTWNGGAGNWTDNNWSSGLPLSTSNVFIDNGNPVVSTVMLNVSATVNNLTLDPTDTLTFDPTTSLTVNGNASLNGTTNVGLGILTLNRASTNAGSMNIASETLTILGHTITFEGVVNGAGTLTNTGVIEGAGNINIPLVNSGTIAEPNILATDPNHPLILSANVNQTTFIGLAGTSGTLVLNGATVTGGYVDGNLAAKNGATLNNAGIGFDPSSTVNLADGSTLAIQGTVNNQSRNSFYDVAFFRS